MSDMLAEEDDKPETPRRLLCIEWKELVRSVMIASILSV